MRNLKVHNFDTIYLPKLCCRVVFSQYFPIEVFYETVYKV